MSKPFFSLLTPAHQTSTRGEPAPTQNLWSGGESGDAPIYTPAVPEDPSRWASGIEDDACMGDPTAPIGAGQSPEIAQVLDGYGADGGASACAQPTSIPNAGTSGMLGTLLNDVLPLTANANALRTGISSQLEAQCFAALSPAAQMEELRIRSLSGQPAPDLVTGQPNQGPRMAHERPMHRRLFDPNELATPPVSPERAPDYFDEFVRSGGPTAAPARTLFDAPELLNMDGSLRFAGLLDCVGPLADALDSVSIIDSLTTDDPRNNAQLDAHNVMNLASNAAGIAGFFLNATPVGQILNTWNATWSLGSAFDRLTGTSDAIGRLGNDAETVDLALQPFTEQVAQSDPRMAQYVDDLETRTACEDRGARELNEAAGTNIAHHAPQDVLQGSGCLPYRQEYIEACIESTVTHEGRRGIDDARRACTELGESRFPTNDPLDERIEEGEDHRAEVIEEMRDAEEERRSANRPPSRDTSSAPAISSRNFVQP